MAGRLFACRLPPLARRKAACRGSSANLYPTQFGTRRLCLHISRTAFVGADPCVCPSCPASVRHKACLLAKTSSRLCRGRPVCLPFILPHPVWLGRTRVYAFRFASAAFGRADTRVSPYGGCSRCLQTIAPSVKQALTPRVPRRPAPVSGRPLVGPSAHADDEDTRARRGYARRLAVGGAAAEGCAVNAVQRDALARLCPAIHIVPSSHLTATPSVAAVPMPVGVMPKHTRSSSLVMSLR